MMPELGKYAVAVLAAYGVSIGLVIFLIGTSVLRDRRISADLHKVEARREPCS